MCVNCGINHDTNELEDQDALNAFLEALFADNDEEPEIQDFMDEYRTEADVTVTGDWWSVAVAKIGGTDDVTRVWEPGEHFIINLYEDDVLTDSMVVDAVTAKSTQQVANEFAGHMFGYEV